MRKNHAFVSFAECERKKLLLSETIEQLSRHLNEYKKKLYELENTRKDAEQRVADIQKKIHLVELDLKSLESREIEIKQRLLHTGNAKEYESLMKEIESGQKKKVELEEAILVLWDERDTARNTVQTIIEETKQQMAEIEDEIAQCSEMVEQKKSELVEQSKECMHFMTFVDEELLAVYNSMLKTVANPAVPIENESCSGCFYTVPRSDLMLVAKDKIIRCTDCYRLLYTIPMPT